VKAKSKQIAGTLFRMYDVSNPGTLPPPYFWWEAGGVLGGLISYWHYTGDDEFNVAVAQGLVSQMSTTNDFMMPACTGNDDEGWFAVASMSAAEYGLPNPGSLPWLNLAQNVFKNYQSRWDNSTCNGGLRWQISPTSGGYTYKNSISNGLMFQLAARLYVKPSIRFLGHVHLTSVF
jgi:mannan endo-1,6-alpha-mannosidase